MTVEPDFDEVAGIGIGQIGFSKNLKRLGTSIVVRIMIILILYALRYQQ